MKRKYLSIISIFLLLIMAIACVIEASINNNQAKFGIPIPIEFIGEYSYDGENWLPLEDNSDISVNNGNLKLRGHFNQNITEGARFNYYRNHIGISVFINQKLCYMDAQSEVNKIGIGLMPSMCGEEWACFVLPNISTDDQVEINFINFHNYGNATAYRDALNTFCITPNVNEILENHLSPYIKLFQITAIIIIIVAVMLIGASIASIILNRNITGKLFKFGLLMLFTGGYIIFDAMYIFSIDEILAVKTYGRQLCMMLAVYIFGLIISDALSGKKKKVVDILLGISCAFNLVLLGTVFAGKMLIFDTQFYWILSQLVLCPVLLICLIHEVWFAKNNRNKKIDLICYSALLIGIVLDCIGLGKSIFWGSVFTKNIFVVVFIFNFIKGVKQIILENQATIKNEKLKKELENSKIELMLSQIQPHFLYNSLTSVMDLCDTNPKQAKNAIADFADYLRGNLAFLKEQKLILFSNELRHIQKYLRLEELRFKEELEVIYDIKTENFLVPSLSIQPLVENAVKHGISNKIGGGRVIISTFEIEDAFVVEIKDNGVGFEKESLNDGNIHIGIDNVKNRLKMMINADLEINSKKDEGTTVRVNIPKRRD